MHLKDTYLHLKICYKVHLGVISFGNKYLKVRKGVIFLCMYTNFILNIR